jgi:hypothetical protein
VVTRVDALRERVVVLPDSLLALVAMTLSSTFSLIPVPYDAPARNASLQLAAPNSAALPVRFYAAVILVSFSR